MQHLKTLRHKDAHTYKRLNSACFTPRADCCFMWLQLYSFQNILSYQFQQRLRPLVVWVHQKEEGEEEVGACLPNVLVL